MKQIEEMAKVMLKLPILFSCKISIDCLQCNYFKQIGCQTKLVAEALYNAGCRKVGDNEVVIDKGFFDDLIAGNVTRYIKETDNIIISKEEYKNSRKETAREILQKLNKLANQPITFFDMLVDIRVCITKLAEKFGVEVE